MLKVIRNVVVEPDYCVRLTFSEGAVKVVDFRPVIERGGVFGTLGSPDVFAQVKCGEDGRYLEWPGEIDFCADALWLRGRSVNRRPRKRPPATKGGRGRTAGRRMERSA